jgi:hypothetical protein
VKYYIASSIQKALALRRSLEHLKTGDYPSDSPRVLVELLLVLADNILESLIRLASKQHNTSDEVEPDEVLVLGRAIAQLARFAEPVARSSLGYVPWGLVFPVETLCRQISPESRVIIYPCWEYNYTYYEAMALLKRIMNGIGDTSGEGIFRGYPRYFAILSFPAMEGLNILQNAAWGHEIGHHLNAVFGIADRVMEQPILDASDVSDAVAEFRRASGQESLPLESQDQVQVAVLETVMRLTRNWVTELVADVFSIQIFGPASLFAFSDIVPVLYPLDQPDPAHPPARFRISIMLKELKELGYEELFAIPSTTETEEQIKMSVSAEIARLRTVSAQEPKRHIGPYYLPAMRALQTAVPFIVEEVDRLSSGRWACSAGTLGQDVFKLVNRLINGVPPCEVDDDGSLMGRQTHLAAIVNAGWFYRIWRRPHLPPQNESKAISQSGQLDQLNDLILKAIELSDIGQQLRTKESSSGSGKDGS